MPLVGGAGLLVELVQRASVPESTIYDELWAVEIERDRVGGVSLERDCVGSGSGGEGDDAFGCI